MSTTEHEPLLGAPGDVAQEDRPIWHNLFMGTGIVAQFGAGILLALVWSGVFSNQLFPLFSPHPLLNSAAIFLAVQAILILQPTHTASQKKTGTYTHATLVGIAALAFLSAFIIIEVNKARNHPVHFESVHSILGLVTYILVLIQAAVGVTQYFFPALYGSEAKAKSVYKYHRISGYMVLALMTATVSAATWTDYNLNVLKIHHWSVITASVILLGGLYARIKKQKLGF